MVVVCGGREHEFVYLAENKKRRKAGRRKVRAAAMVSKVLVRRLGERVEWVNS